MSQPTSEPTIPEPPQPEGPLSKSTLRLGGQVLGSVGGVLLVQYLGLEDSIKFFAGGAAGALCGLLPYWLAKKRGRLDAARRSMWACTVAGLVLGLILALPVSLMATAVVLARARKDDESVNVAQSASEDVDSN